MLDPLLEYRLTEGMPSAVIGGRRRGRQAEVESWLELRDDLRKEGAGDHRAKRCEDG